MNGVVRKMFITSPFNDSLFLYGNRQIEYHSPAISFYPVIEANRTKEKKKDFFPKQTKRNKLHFSRKKSIISEKVVQLTLMEITGKGRFINEQA